MKKNNDVFSWGDFDSNDKKHFVGGLAIYAILFLIAFGNDYYDILDMGGLGIHWLALMGTFVAACLWEYRQIWISKAKFDWKDVFISCLVGIIATACIAIFG